MDLGRFRIAQAALTKKTAKRADVLAAALLLSTLKPAEDEQQFTMCETLIEESLLRGYFDISSLSIFNFVVFNFLSCFVILTSIGICFQTYNHDVEILAPLMHTLYCIGSVDRFVTSVVEFGAHVSVIKVLKQHSVRVLLVWSDL
jgi:hypothetical protein